MYAEPNYKPPFYLFNPHLETVVPSMLRKVRGVEYNRERIKTPDDDFLDLDWVARGSNKIIVISHGLEGSSDRPYVRGLAKAFQKSSWDVLAWNCRSCSGEINRQLRMYHHGDTEDLNLVVTRALEMGYSKIMLAGISMGGSMTLKYLGEGRNLPEQILGGVAFSVPVDLKSSVVELSKPENSFYKKRFLKKLRAKIKLKNRQFPGILDLQGIDQIDSFEEFDTRYTAVINGFKDAEDFYTRASSLPYLQGIDRPVLLVNAWNDPFLGEECYPIDLAEDHDYLNFEITEYGGHIGFLTYGAQTWVEQRAIRFANEALGL